jgi:RNA polymerase sigma factor (sigma-70 family)
MPFDAAPANTDYPATSVLGCLDVDNGELARLARREAAAQTVIFRRFERPLYSFARRLLGRDADALDVLQDSFIQAFTRIDEFQRLASFGAWLRGIALHRCLRLLRERTLKATEPIGEADDYLRVDDRERIEQAHDLDAALAQLGDRTRTVLWLYCVERYSHQEIADFFGQSLSFSKSQLARGLKQMQRLLSTQPEHVHE